MANRHLSYDEFKNIFGDLGVTEWTKYNWLDNNFNLPSNLVRVEYLQTVDGSYIDTGISDNDLTTVRVLTKIELINTNQDQTIFGCSSNGSTDYQYYQLTPFQNSWYFGTNGSAQSNAGTYNPVVGTIYEIDFNNSGRIFINNEQIGTSYTFKTKGNLLVNGRLSAARYGQYKYYYFKVFVDGELVRSFVPVFNTTTGKYGLYDLVGRQFYGNAGTGDFTGPYANAVKLSTLNWNKSGSYQNCYWATTADYTQEQRAKSQLAGNDNYNYYLTDEVYGPEGTAMLTDTIVYPYREVHVHATADLTVEDFVATLGDSYVLY